DGSRVRLPSVAGPRSQSTARVCVARPASNCRPSISLPPMHTRLKLFWRSCELTVKPTSTRRPLNSWGSCPWRGRLSQPTRCSLMPISAGKSARPRETTSSLLRRTNQLCCVTSRSPLPPERPFPPYQQRLRDAARTQATTIDKGHGRRERRTLIATTELTPYLQPNWPDLQQVCQITRERWEKGVHTIEVAYRITSLEPERANAQRLLALDR